MRLVLCGLVVLSVALGSCASVDVVRLQPELLQTPEGTEPLAGIQASCVGFYLFTLGIPEADMDRAVNELLLKEAKKLGADRLINFRFEGTPGDGIWWLTKIFGIRTATASAVAVVNRASDRNPKKPEPQPLLPPPPTD